MEIHTHANDTGDSFPVNLKHFSRESFYFLPKFCVLLEDIGLGAF